ncbi:MAG TPA: galactokinase [Allosphingosinicella sp.]|uniref:galactokinase n=1 Tax=Allosphingosinicella sp. TaxID=2823234 RepID=UPI002F28A946
MPILQTRLAEGFAQRFGGAPDLVVRAPGRVNLIGEHTDYNDGFAMPVAIGPETRVAVRRRGEGEIRVTALNFGEEDAFVPSADLQKAAQGGWRDYIRGTVAILAREGVDIGGLDIAVMGDVPMGTGLSSSASLEVAVATAVLALAGRQENPKQVALWAQAAENDFVGMRCGNLDQLASAATVEGAALLIDCRSLDLRPIRMPSDAAVMIVQSGVVRGLVEGHYNERRRQCEAAAAILGVPALRDADLAMLEAVAADVDPLVVRRARHVITENDRTLAAAEALALGDLQAVGVLMRESHASQRDDFEITVPLTDRLAELMSEAIGEHGGARQTGGGFGGAVVGLMRNDRVEAVRERVLSDYRTPSGELPDVRVERACSGASVEIVGS